MGGLGRVAKGLSVLTMALALTAVVAGPALAGAGHGQKVATMRALSDATFDPVLGSGISTTRPLSDASFGRDGATGALARALSDSTFDPETGSRRVPAVSVPHAAQGASAPSSQAWSTDWRTIMLTILAGLMSLGLVSTLYLRGRRPAI